MIMSNLFFKNVLGLKKTKEVKVKSNFVKLLVLIW